MPLTHSSFCDWRCFLKFLRYIWETFEERCDLMHCTANKLACLDNLTQFYIRNMLLWTNSPSQSSLSSNPNSPPPNSFTNLRLHCVTMNETLSEKSFSRNKQKYLSIQNVSLETLQFHLIHIIIGAFPLSWLKSGNLQCSIQLNQTRTLAMALKTYRQWTNQVTVYHLKIPPLCVCTFAYKPQGTLSKYQLLAVFGAV